MFQGAQIYDSQGQQIKDSAQQRISVNLEDAVLQEQKLYSILEVSEL